MRIGLISDTRAAVPDEVPPQAFRALEGVDLILHAGGINTREVLDHLERVAPVKAAGRTTGDRTEGPSTSTPRALATTASRFSTSSTSRATPSASSTTSR